MHWLVLHLAGGSLPRAVETQGALRRSVAAASAAGVTGAALVAVDVDARGSTTGARVIRGAPDPHRSRAAVEAAMRLQFEPGALHGRPVRVTGLRIGVNFGGAVDIRRRGR